MGCVILYISMNWQFSLHVLWNVLCVHVFFEWSILISEYLCKNIYVKVATVYLSFRSGLFIRNIQRVGRIKNIISSKVKFLLSFLFLTNRWKIRSDNSQCLTSSISSISVFTSSRSVALRFLQRRIGYSPTRTNCSEIKERNRSGKKEPLTKPRIFPTLRRCNPMSPSARYLF